MLRDATRSLYSDVLMNKLAARVGACLFLVATERLCQSPASECVCIRDRGSFDTWNDEPM